MKNINKLPELLAPAGNMRSLEAAIEAGADAVYFGSTSFSCRMRADNFDEDNIKSALKLCRDYNRKAYITINTRLKDTEIDDVRSLLDVLCDNGVDAIITTDLAVVDLARKYYPNLSLHASTQVTGVSSFDAKALENLGFSRMVCPRELSYGQIKDLVEKSPIGIEMFIHGAHCASVSGQCLASFVMGGRSGNRGECAQPCRLTYKITGDNTVCPLSLKDMCLAGHIKDIIDLGVESLKIEGRLKSAEYCYGVTSIYRKLLDERRNASSEEITYLSDLFSRDGFTDGYFTNKYSNMLGVRSETDINNSKQIQTFNGLTIKQPLNISLIAHKNKPAELVLSDNGSGFTGRSYSNAFVEALKTPITESQVIKNITKFGGTSYVADKTKIDLDEGLWISNAELNLMRREALLDLDNNKLIAKKAKGNAGTISENIDIKATNVKKSYRSAEFLRIKDIPNNAKQYFDDIFIPVEEYYEGCGYGINLSPVAFDDNFPFDAVKKAGKVMIHSLGQLAAAKETGAKIVASYRMNVFNNVAYNELIKLGVDNIVVSPELNLVAVKPFDNASIVIYGRLPLMVLARCPQAKTNKNCVGCGGCSTGKIKKDFLCINAMKDRKGKIFPLVGMRDCMNILYNSVPLYMADKQKELDKYGINGTHFVFSIESQKEASDVIDDYINENEPKILENIRRVK